MHIISNINNRITSALDVWWR